MGIDVPEIATYVRIILDTGYTISISKSALQKLCEKFQGVGEIG